MLRQCTVLSAQRLSGPVDCDKRTESGSDLEKKVNGEVFFFACLFYTLARRGRKSSVIHQDRGVCHRHLLSYKSLNSGTQTLILQLTWRVCV